MHNVHLHLCSLQIRFLIKFNAKDNLFITLVYTVHKTWTWIAWAKCEPKPMCIVNANFCLCDDIRGDGILYLRNKLDCQYKSVCTVFFVETIFFLLWKTDTSARHIVIFAHRRLLFVVNKIYTKFMWRFSAYHEWLHKIRCVYLRQMHTMKECIDSIKHVIKSIDARRCIYTNLKLYFWVYISIKYEYLHLLLCTQTLQTISKYINWIANIF